MAEEALQEKEEEFRFNDALNSKSQGHLNTI